MSTIIKAANLHMVDVPYDGDGTMVPALLGGHIPVATPVLYVIKSLLEAKKLKVLAVALQKRAPSAPDIPTIAELGYKLPFVSFLGLFAPKKTPDNVVKKLDDTIRKILDDKDFQEKNKAMDMPVDFDGPAAFEKYLANYKKNAQAFFKEQGMTK
jgi:tripartite-type tricarboxylate transporter receptor subunit TctC